MRSRSAAGEAMTHDEPYGLLRAYEGRAAASGGEGRDPVNEAMIRHWCEAMGDTNPAYPVARPQRPQILLLAVRMAIGATEFSKDSGRSELKLAVEAVQAALDDAGLSPADVDGLVTFTMDTSPEITVAQACGIGELTFFSRVHYGGGAARALVTAGTGVPTSGLLLGADG